MDFPMLMEEARENKKNCEIRFTLQSLWATFPSNDKDDESDDDGNDEEWRGEHLWDQTL